MWVFTTKGFMSIIQDKDDPSVLVVRARTKKHLKALFPKSRIVTTQIADYRYRIFVSRDKVTKVITEELRKLTYSNFKNQILDEDYHDACLDTWSAMNRMQSKIIRRDVIGGTSADSVTLRNSYVRESKQCQ